MLYAGKRVKAISFDVTGTVLSNAHYGKVYKVAANKTNFLIPPNLSNIDVAFKLAFKTQIKLSPCYGVQENISAREWWRRTVRLTLENCGYHAHQYTDREFDRFFRHIYQSYGSPQGYEVFPDALRFLERIKYDYPFLSLGVLTNSPMRTIETALPIHNIHQYFDWFVCCQDVGFQKPHPLMFDAAFSECQRQVPDIQRHEILHIGDSVEADYNGAKSAGFQSIILNRGGKTIPTAMNCGAEHVVLDLDEAAQALTLG